MEVKLLTADDKLLSNVNGVIRQLIPGFEIGDRYAVLFGNPVEGLAFRYNM